MESSLSSRCAPDPVLGGPKTGLQPDPESVLHPRRSRGAEEVSGQGEGFSSSVLGAIDEGRQDGRSDGISARVKHAPGKKQEQTLFNDSRPGRKLPKKLYMSYKKISLYQGSRDPGDYLMNF